MSFARPTPTVAFLLLFSSLVFAATASISSVSGTTPVALNLESYTFSASYVNSSASSISTGACNFTMYPANGSTTLFPSVYNASSGSYLNSSTSLSFLPSAGNYTLEANCSAAGFDSAAANLSVPVEVKRAGIALSANPVNVTRYDSFGLSVFYYDSLSSTPSVLDPINPAKGGACTMEFVNSTGGIANSSAMAFNSTTLAYELVGAVGSSGFNLAKGDYTYRPRCTSTNSTFENRTALAPFSVLPLTCGYVATSNLTLEESATCSGAKAIANANTPMITVSSPNLVIDCAGFTLTGPANNSLFITGIAVEASGTTAKNCRFQSFDVGLELFNSQNNTFSSLTFASNFFDVLLSRGSTPTDVFGNSFTGLFVLSSLATWDYSRNSSQVNNSNSSTAIASFDNLNVTANGSTISYGAFAIGNASGINWTAGVNINSTQVGISPALALALDKAATLTLTGASYANTSVYEVRINGTVNCTSCARIGANPARFTVPGFFPNNNYTTIAVAPPAGNDSNASAPPAPAPAPAPPAAPSGTPPAPTEPVTSQTNLPTTTPAGTNAASANASNLTNLTSNRTNHTALTRSSPFGLTGLFTSGRESLAKLSSFVSQFVKEQPLAAAGAGGYVLLLFAATTALKLQMRRETGEKKKGSAGR